MNNNRILYLDIINVVSCFSVVALHCDSYIHQYNHADNIWWLRVLINVLFYNAVPLFFMLSGATLVGYHKKYGTKTFFRKRIKKTLLPFLAMSLFFSVLFVISAYDDKAPIDIVKTIIVGFLTGNVPFTTYWFFIPLFLLYVFMPFISIMVEHLTEKQLLGLIGLLFILQSCIVPIISLSNRISWIGVPVHSLPICGYVLYALLGYYITHSNIEKSNKALTSIVCLAVVMLAFRYILVYNATSHSPKVFNYMAVYAVLPSVAIFMMVKRFCIGTNNRFVTLLAKRSFGVFLIQQFVIMMSFKLIPPPDIKALCMIPLVYLVCCTIVYVVQQFKFTKWLMP